tara:strand:+ start:2475 stop:3257 length:783 start_codon:yes stop_codon:yes gene_type:complete
MTIAFNLSQLANYVNSSGKLDAANGLVNATPVANGGTGAATATAYAVQCGGTTSTGAHQSIASVGTAGQVLTSNGASALPTFQASVGGQFAYALYTSGSGNWTCPANVTKVLAVVIGGGAGSSGGGAGYSGGIAIGIYTVVPSTNYAYVVGAGSAGTGGTAGSGGSSNFSSFCSASGGQNYTGAVGIGSNGNLSNWHVPDYNESGISMSGCVGGVFVGANVGLSTTSGNWSPTHGNLPGVAGTVVTNYAGGGVVYLQYVG